ncbi:MAG: hypothetical protein Q8P02_05515, partial [Candidatus Micrarchaeota archaeon]|nr:hypothetical protein [Candidatus Micrarchaeota archaeon]
MGSTMRLLFSFLVLAAFSISLSAVSLFVTDPVLQKLGSSDVLDLGVAGPGQKIVIVAERPAGQDSNNSANPSEALWDRIVPANLPDGWSFEPSKFYENPFQAFVSISPDAADGEYRFSVNAVDEYDGLAPTTFSAKIRVSSNVLSASLSKASESTGAGQPAVYYLSLRNTGSASDVFDVSAKGLPAGWVPSRRVFVPHNSVVSVSVPVTPQEAGTYSFTVSSTSLSSDRIAQK